MADLVAIDAEPPGRSVQSTLRKLLREAKAGNISAIAVAIVHRDGSVSQDWSELHSVPVMLGCVSRLEHHLNLELDEA